MNSRPRNGVNPLALAALSLAALSLTAGTAVAHDSKAGRAALAGAATTPAEVLQALEAEKSQDNLWKAYFPSREIGRKAAISFHANLLESQWEQGYLVMELDAEEMDRLRAFGFRFERAAEFIAARNKRLTMLQMLQAGRVAGSAEPTSIPGYTCYETVEETFTAGDGLIAARPLLASWVDAGDSWLKTQGAGGYDLRVLKLTNSARVPAGGSTKPKLFINSAIHAREYTTAPLVLSFARWLVDGYGVNADATWILDHHEVHLMLHANPRRPQTRRDGAVVAQERQQQLLRQHQHTRRRPQPQLHVPVEQHRRRGLQRHRLQPQLPRPQRRQRNRDAGHRGLHPQPLARPPRPGSE